jgi:hypothetical protein
MSYGVIDTSKLVSIDSFHEAKREFESIKEIRGQNKHEVGVPLRHNRKDWHKYSLVKLNDYSYAAKLYDTDVVTWHIDGSVHINATYGSVTTASFANHYAQLTGIPMRFAADGMQFGCKLSALCKEMRDRYDFEVAAKDRSSWADFAVAFGSGGTLFTKSDDGWCFDYVPAYKEYVDKSAAHGVRKAFAPLFDFLKIFRAYPMEQYLQVLTDFYEIEPDQAYRSGSVHGARGNLTSRVVKRPDNETLWAPFAAAWHEPVHRWERGGYTSKTELAETKVIKHALYDMAYRQAGILNSRKLPFGKLAAGWTR